MGLLLLARLGVIVLPTDRYGNFLGTSSRLGKWHLAFAITSFAAMYTVIASSASMMIDTF